MDIAGHHGKNGNVERQKEALDMLPPRLLCVALVIALVSTIISLSASATGIGTSTDGEAAIHQQSHEHK